MVSLCRVELVYLCIVAIIKATTKENLITAFLLIEERDKIISNYNVDIIAHHIIQLSTANHGNCTEQPKSKKRKSFIVFTLKFKQSARSAKQDIGRNKMKLATKRGWNTVLKTHVVHCIGPLLCFPERHSCSIRKIHPGRKETTQCMIK